MKTTAKTTERMPERCEAEAQHLHDARCKAVKALGKNWQLHPEYKHNPRHSTNAGVYEVARQPYFAEVARLGAADRARNPAFIRAEAVRAALGVTP